jgi:hypothetical protein
MSELSSYRRLRLFKGRCWRPAGNRKTVLLYRSVASSLRTLLWNFKRGTERCWAPNVIGGSAATQLREGSTCNCTLCIPCLLTSLCIRLRLKCDGTRAETRFRLSAKRTSPFKSAGASVQSTSGSRGVRISGSNAGYTVFRGSVKGTGYALH